MAFDDSYFNPQPYRPTSLTGAYPQFDSSLNLPALGDRPYTNTYFGEQPKQGQTISGISGLTGALGKEAAKKIAAKAGGKALTGIAGKLASKGGLLGKLGKGAKGSPTPWMIGGTAASLLGNKIAQKHAKTGSFIGGAGSGAALGASIGSIIPGIGTAIGGLAGGLLGGIKGLFKGRKMNKEKKKAEQAALAQAQGPAGRGPVASDPYGQLRAETEARYAQPAFDYMGSYNKLMSGFPAAGGQDYVKYSQQKAEPYYTGEGMGGLATFGG